MQAAAQYDPEEERYIPSNRPSIEEPVRTKVLLVGDKEKEDPELRARIEAIAAIVKAEEQRRGIRPRPIAPGPQPCWAIASQEGMVCDAGRHYDPTKQGADLLVWPCRAERVRTEHRRLASLLLKCGVPLPNAYDGPISPLLCAAWEFPRPVQIARFDQAAIVPLDTVVQMLREIVPLLLARNGLFHGTVGSGKTHLALMLFFMALEVGIDAVWIDDLWLRRLVTDRTSFNELVRSEADMQWAVLLKRSVIFYSELGGDDDPPARSASHPYLAMPLLKIFEEGKATIWANTNLPPEAEKGERCLGNHVDVGERVLSRLLADRTDAAALAQAAQRAAAQGRVLTAQERGACMHPALILKFLPLSEESSDQRLHGQIRAHQSSKMQAGRLQKGAR